MVSMIYVNVRIDSKILIDLDIKKVFKLKRLNIKNVVTMLKTHLLAILFKTFKPFCSRWVAFLFHALQALFPLLRRDPIAKNCLRKFKNLTATTNVFYNSLHRFESNYKLSLKTIRHQRVLLQLICLVFVKKYNSKLKKVIP